ncbi:MAG: PucR family transcriptional regulator [Actinomycetes bacterium]
MTDAADSARLPAELARTPAGAALPGDLGRPVLADVSDLVDPARPLTAVAAELAHGVDDVTDRATGRILETIAGYAPTRVVPREDLWWSVRRNVELVLVTLVTGELPGEPDLAVRRELGVRRAEQGLALADLLRAFRVGYLAVWESLSEAAHLHGPAAVSALAEQAALVWGAMDAVSSAVADGYRDRATALDVDQRRRVHALLEALRGADAAVVIERALEAGIDPAATLHVAACRGLHASQVPVGTGVEQGDHTVVLLTEAAAVSAGLAHEEGSGEVDVDAALAGALRTAGATHVGTGRGRAGVTAGGGTLRQAESALRAAIELDEPVVAFDDDWLACTVLDNAADLRDALAPVIAHLTDDAEARATVTAFLDADGNLTRAAALLHLHPNGVAYRVRRLAEQTGLDLRTSAGARAAHVALLLARAGGAGRAGGGATAGGHTPPAR